MNENKLSFVSGKKFCFVLIRANTQENRKLKHKIRKRKRGKDGLEQRFFKWSMDCHVGSLSNRSENF
jgi:hypothetical protein